MTRSRVLLVDDNDDLLAVTKELLELRDFEVVSATTVTEALSLIITQSFDVLITDLQMPDPGDGFAVVTAMRHSQPGALTMVISGFPDVQGAMAAILLQADEILVKPLDVPKISEIIRSKLQADRPSPRTKKENIASILERDEAVTIQGWLKRVKQTQALNSIPLTDEERTAHLPGLIRNIVARIRRNSPLEAVAIPSDPAVAHGRLRCQQGYTAPLIVQESRILQVSLFETIQRNLATLDFSVVLPHIMLLADEVDSQLTQSIGSFLEGAA